MQCCIVICFSGLAIIKLFFENFKYIYNIIFIFEMLNLYLKNYKGRAKYNFFYNENLRSSCFKPIHGCWVGIQ